MLYLFHLSLKNALLYFLAIESNLNLLQMSFFSHEEVISVLAAPALLGNSGVVKVPRVVHHELEVGIIVDRHGNVVVVLEPLLKSDRTVTSISMTLHVGVVILERVKELSEDLVLGLLAGLNVGMSLGVVALTNVIDVELARFVDVHNLVDLGGDVLTEWVHRAADGAEELIVRN